jgi:hypothetical protein
VTSLADLDHRLWRARRRHHHIDALLRQADAEWHLMFQYDDRPMVTWSFADRDAASDEAARRLRDLQRAGWNLHW